MAKNRKEIPDPERDFEEEKPKGWGRKLIAIVLVLAAVMGAWAFVTAFILIEPREEVKPVPVVDHYPEDPAKAVELEREAWERIC